MGMAGVWALVCTCVWLTLSVRGQGTPGGLRPEEMDSIGREWDARLRRGEVVALTARVDWDRLVLRALEGLPGTVAGRQGFAASFATNAAVSFERSLRGFATLRYLGIPATNTEGGIVFRGLLPDGSMNHHRYRLERRPDGVGISDLYILSGGEWFSASVRRVYLLAEGRRGTVWTTGVTPLETELMRNTALVDRVVGLAAKGLAREVLDAARGLPPLVQEERTVLLMRLSAAQVVDPGEFAAASAVWRRLYPNDPGLDLLTFERLARAGEHAKSAEALRRIDAFVGGDPHLRALIGSETALAGQADLGRRMAEEVVRIEPDLPTGYDAGIGIELHLKRYAEVAKWLDRAADNLATDPREIVRTRPQYEAFRESEEGKKWLATEPEAKIVGGTRRSGAPLRPSVRTDATVPEPPEALKAPKK